MWQTWVCASSFERIVTNHCLAAVDLGVGFEAANGLSHHLKPSGSAVHEGVDGLDIRGQHGRCMVCSSAPR